MVVSCSGLTLPCASSRTRAPVNPSKAFGLNTASFGDSLSVYLPLSRRPYDLRFMAARGTLLLRTLLRSFELGRSPSTASFPTSRFPLPESDMRWQSPLSLSPPPPLSLSHSHSPLLCVVVGVVVGFSSFFGCVRRTPFTRVNPPHAEPGVKRAHEAGSERRFFVHSMRARWAYGWKGRLEFGHRSDLFSDFDPRKDPSLLRQTTRVLALLCIRLHLFVFVELIGKVLSEKF